MAVITSGDWFAKAGGEAEFQALWRQMSTVASAEVDPTGWSILLRDRENPRHFISFSRWNDEAAVVRWRDGVGLSRFMNGLTELLEHADSSLFEVAEVVGDTQLKL